MDLNCCFDVIPIQVFGTSFFLPSMFEIVIQEQKTTFGQNFEAVWLHGFFGQNPVCIEESQPLSTDGFSL